MIARHLLIVCLIYTSLVTQSSLAADVVLFGFRPWFPGIVLMACTLLHQGGNSLVWAALLGLSVDCLSGERLGVNVVTATLVAAGMTSLKTEVPVTGTATIVLFVFTGTIGWRVASATVHCLLANRMIDGLQILISASGSGLYTAIVTLGVLLVVQLPRFAIRSRSRSTPIALTNRWSMLTR